MRFVTFIGRSVEGAPSVRTHIHVRTNERPLKGDYTRPEALNNLGKYKEYVHFDVVMKAQDSLSIREN